MKTILVDAVNTFVIPEKGIYQPLFDLLETYPNPKIILTNADDEQVKTFGLVHLPYKLFSLKHNPDKVDPAYFTKMLEHFNLDVSDVVYFEHNAEAVESAKSISINTYHYDKDKKDIDALKQFLDRALI